MKFFRLFDGLDQDKRRAPLLGPSTGKIIRIPTQPNCQHGTPSSVVDSKLLSKTFGNQKIRTKIRVQGNLTSLDVIRMATKIIIGVVASNGPVRIKRYILHGLDGNLKKLEREHESCVSVVYSYGQQIRKMEGV